MLGFESDSVSALHQFTQTTAEQIVSLFSEIPFALLWYNHQPSNPLDILHNTWPKFDISTWQAGPVLKKHTAGWGMLRGAPIFLTASRPNLAQGVFIFKNDPGQELKGFLENRQNQWNELELYLKEQSGQLETEYGNLISQLLHDIRSYMHLSPAVSEEARLRQRYQERVNERLLTFVRPLEMLQSRMPLKDLLHSAIEAANLDEMQLRIDWTEDCGDINADAELFALAIREVLQNARDAQSAESEPVEISCRRLAGNCFIGPQAWIQITISDSGPGIKEDFLPHVLEPFFTTQKQAGHSGFGLTLVLKIMTAHGGTVEVNNRTVGGTDVLLSFPVYE